MEIYIREFYRKALGNNPHEGVKVNRIGPWEKLSCRAAARESSADFMRISGAERAFQKFSYVKTRGLSHCTPASTNHWMWAAPGQEA